MHGSGWIVEKEKRTQREELWFLWSSLNQTVGQYPRDHVPLSLACLGEHRGERGGTVLCAVPFLQPAVGLVSSVLPEPGSITIPISNRGFLISKSLKYWSKPELCYISMCEGYWLVNAWNDAFFLTPGQPRWRHEVEAATVSLGRGWMFLSGGRLGTQPSDPACNGEISTGFGKRHVPLKDVFNPFGVWAGIIRPGSLWQTGPKSARTFKNVHLCDMYVCFWMKARTEKN